MSDGPSSIHLLRNTTYLLSLARRAALNSADTDQRKQAIQLGPVLREIKSLTRAVETLQPTSTQPLETDTRYPQTQNGAKHLQMPSQPSPEAPTGILAQDDFQALLTASRQQPNATTGPAEAPLDRTTIALGMAQGGASELEIARALGLSRGEVDLILNIAKQQR